jgi:hypothetical protein
MTATALQTRLLPEPATTDQLMVTDGLSWYAEVELVGRVRDNPDLVDDVAYLFYVWLLQSSPGVVVTAHQGWQYMRIQCNVLCPERAYYQMALEKFWALWALVQGR